MSKFYGYSVDENMIICDAMTLPNATTKDSSNMVFVGNSAALVEIRVYANTDINIASADSFSIELETYDSDSSANAAPPYYNNSSGWESDAHFYLLYKDSSDDDLLFKAGDLITAMAVPEGLLKSRGYLQLKFTASADVSAQKVDAFAHVLV
ncbi:MAG: hypothetical protein K8S56_02415 [Candidatus Cloacimonetes bacterium]|nr:hypothetical protein [Candidatus Cloacimonadota bacterium]